MRNDQTHPPKKLLGRLHETGDSDFDGHCLLQRLRCSRDIPEARRVNSPRPILCNYGTFLEICLCHSFELWQLRALTEEGKSTFSTRRIGGKILIPASTVRRFAREDHPESVRAVGIPTSTSAKTESQLSSAPPTRFAPQSETNDDAAPLRASGSR